MRTKQLHKLHFLYTIAVCRFGERGFVRMVVVHLTQAVCNKFQAEEKRYDVRDT